MSIIKRKRGRPRLDESHEYNEFDLNLIQEFKKNPVLYDRTHPEHRNREYTERIWNRIAHNIKASPSHIKNRILQLRNRYNVEKRRIEALQEQQPDTCITSQWSLYKYLTFLNDYTRSRRPYSMPSSTYQSRSSTAATAIAAITGADTGTGAVSSDADDSQTVANGNLESSDEITNSISQMPNINNTNVQLYDILAKNSVRINGGGGGGTEYVGQRKFKDFGQFLASALMQMHDMQALALIHKFTNEVVKTLKTYPMYQNVVNGEYVQIGADGGGDDGGGGGGSSGDVHATLGRPLHDSDSMNSDS